MTRPRYDFVAATFQFFIAVGRRPMGALWIGFWQMLLLCAVSAGALAVFWPVFELMAHAAEADIEAEMIAVFLQMMGWMMLLGLAGVLIYLMAQGAWLRLLTRDEIRPVIPFRLGADEFRLLGVNVLFIMFWMAVYIVSIILVAAIVATGGGAQDFGGTAIIALVGTLIVLAVVVFLIIICLRFAAAPALSVHQRRFRLFQAVSASKGVWGMMFLSYLTLIAVWIAGAVVVSMVQQIALLFGAAEFIGAMMAFDPAAGSDPAQILALLGETLTSPAGIAIIAVIVVTQFIFQITFEGLWHGVGAYVARRHGEAVAADAAPAPAPAEPETAQ